MMIVMYVMASIMVDARVLFEFIC